MEEFSLKIKKERLQCGEQGVLFSQKIREGNLGGKHRTVDASNLVE